LIAYPPSLKAVGGARTGIAPAHLLDVLDVNGNLYYWSDRPMNAPVVVTGAEQAINIPPVPVPPGQQVAWAYPNSYGPSKIFGSGDGTGGTPATPAMWAATALNGTMNVGLTAIYSGPFNDITQYTFSQFKMPPLPVGAVIKNIFPVMSYLIDQGPYATITGPGFGPSEVPGAGNYGGSLGNDESAVTGASLSWTIAASVDVGVISASVTFRFCGLAIYYEGTGGAPGWNFPGEAAYGSGPYIPWIVQVPPFTFHRSLVTDTGSFVLQNLSGDTLSRDFEKIARRSALEGAFFVYRCWQADAEAAWLEVHGTLSVGNIGQDTVQLKARSLINESEADTPLEIYCETCQLQWGGRRCGSTQATECSYSYQTCQVIERPFIVQNNYEKNLGESAAATANTNLINRRRRI